MSATEISGSVAKTSLPDVTPRLSASFCLVSSFVLFANSSLTAVELKINLVTTQTNNSSKLQVNFHAIIQCSVNGANANHLKPV